MLAVQLAGREVQEPVDGVVQQVECLGDTQKRERDLYRRRLRRSLTAARSARRVPIDPSCCSCSHQPATDHQHCQICLLTIRQRGHGHDSGSVGCHCGGGGARGGGGGDGRENARVCIITPDQKVGKIE